MLEMVSVSMLARLKMLNHAFVFVEAAEIIQISDSIAVVQCAFRNILVNRMVSLVILLIVIFVLSYERGRRRHCM